MAAVAGIPTTFYEDVRPHSARTVGYVLAQSGPCLEVQRQETGGSVPNRDFRPITIQALPLQEFPGSWLLGVLVCPDDTTLELSRWAKTLRRREKSRIRFYFHSRSDPVSAMREWTEAGLPDAPFDQDVDSWARFHRLFGLHHAMQVHRDHVR